jgi:hypothetical protein
LLISFSCGRIAAGSLTADSGDAERQKDEPDGRGAEHDRERGGVRAGDRLDRRGDPGNEVVRTTDGRVEEQSGHGSTPQVRRNGQRGWLRLVR